MGHTSGGVTKEQVAQAYAFLNQEEAVSNIIEMMEEPITYKQYKQFLQQLHLWEAGAFPEFADWDAKAEEPVGREMLMQSSNRVAELFETVASEKKEETPEVKTPETVMMPQIDAQTNIRVLLLQKGAPVANEIRFSSNEPYEIEWKRKTKKKEKNQVIRASQLKLTIGETAVVSSKDGEVYLADEKGGRITLGYKGRIFITRHADGYAVVNEVPIEEYLYGVVQSEMPAYFELEALKAQAVCARTYIVTQLMQDNYPMYDADVDDSIRFQVYNQVSPDARVVQAVDATRGQILEKDGEPIQAYFFSTSHGMTSGREIWGLGPLDYLQPVRGNMDGKLRDLSGEEVFREYIRAKNEKDYDASSDMYRWKATLDLTKHLGEVCKLLCEIGEIQPDSVSVTDKDGREVPTQKLTEWKDAIRLEVLERSISGAVQRLLIDFSEGSVELKNENCIRQVLGKWLRLLQDKNGNTVENSSPMLPSVYFYVQPIKDGIVLFGGGLGHGIGMSQYGADGMAKQGADMEHILYYYYRDVKLEQLYPKIKK